MTSFESSREQLPATQAQLSDIFTKTEQWLGLHGTLSLEPNDIVSGHVDGSPIALDGPMVTYDVDPAALQKVLPEVAAGLGAQFELYICFNESHYTPTDDGRLRYQTPSLQITATGEKVVAYCISVADDRDELHGFRLEEPDAPPLAPVFGTASVDELLAVLEAAAAPENNALTLEEAGFLQTLVDNLDRIRIVQDVHVQGTEQQ